MIVQCGKDRRISSYRYGWIIERRIVATKGKNKGQARWEEDRPAYAATLSRALEGVWERIVKESPDCDVEDLTQTLQAASHKVKQYTEQARLAA